MEATERVIINNDWLTFILLGILFLVVLANFLDKKRLRQLAVLPFNTLYFTNFENTADNLRKGFTVFLFISSNLTLSIFLYLLFQKLYPTFFKLYNHPFLIIVGIVFGYWALKYFISLIAAWIFEIEEVRRRAVYIKLSYFLSFQFYLFFLLIFAIYFFEPASNFIQYVLGIYFVFLLVRYFQFLRAMKKMIFINLFYFILYLCTLEIAPFMVLYKWGLG